MLTLHWVPGAGRSSLRQLCSLCWVGGDCDTSHVGPLIVPRVGSWDGLGGFAQGCVHPGMLVPRVQLHKGMSSFSLHLGV